MRENVCAKGDNNALLIVAAKREKIFLFPQEGASQRRWGLSFQDNNEKAYRKGEGI